MAVGVQATALRRVDGALPGHQLTNRLPVLGPLVGMDDRLPAAALEVLLERPTISASAWFACTRRPSGATTAMPLGALANAVRKRSSLSKAAFCS